MAAGFLSGLFGVGGGILIVPGLVLVLSMRQREAHATSLAAIVPIAVAGAVGFALDGAVDWPAAAAVAVGSTAGAVAGTRALRVLPERRLRLAFVVFAVAAAAMMIADTPEAGGRGTMTAGMAAGLFGVGAASGTLAGLLGVGGGIVVVPALILAFGIPEVAAKGTSLAVIIPTALMGTAQNLRHRLVGLRSAVVVGGVGTACAFVGSRLAIGLDSRLSQALFAVLLVGVALRMVASRQPAG